ncbi:MAG TPA: amino acid adenylation domain-containing protein, partial [Longimicrobiaceae bacterium]|nr:amino acid adenylation domain-containing protein [Longimicrobiaceae bacterium]
RLELSGEPSVGELLERVRERALSAQQNQDIPFEQVVEGVQPVRSLAHSPLFQVMFAWQNAPGGEPELPGLALAGVSRGAQQASAKYDLSLSLGESGGRIVGGLVYATSLFERATAERHLGYLRQVLEAMAAGPERGIAGLEMLPEAERRQVVEVWNATAAPYPADLCIHELFEVQVERAPGAVALVFGGEQQVSYAELNARANRLAHHLRALGVGPDVRVGLCVERSVEMIVGVLAVLKAGGAYVPLDPEYPPERLTYMLQDSVPAVLLTQGVLAGRFEALAVPVLALDMHASTWAEQPERNPPRADLTPGCLAYVIYTSGSTGTPKGVMVEHRGASNLVAAQVRAFAVEPQSRVLQFASFSFDACVSEVFMALCRGAALHVPPPGIVLAGEALLEVLAREGITHATLPPAVLGPLTEDAGLGPVRTLVLAGDVVPGALVRRWAPGLRLINAYGPTEATVCATLVECRAEEGANPSIGRPVANARVYILDRAGEPVPVGVAGELFIGGAGVARGYLGRGELTAERFVPDPFGGEPGRRLYRTGDRGRWLPDGTIEFLGRADFQVKVRGYRIEPGEIEAQLSERPEVREAVVLAREDAPGERRLVAYYVGAGAVEAETLRAHLRERLPEYMVPAAYVRLEEMPLTPNGKLDRRALPAPEGNAYTRRGYEAPVGEVEQALAQIWAEVLKVERVGRWDHFFELGGHSLLAVRVLERMRQRGLHLEVRALFTMPVLAELAGEVERERVAVDVPPNLAPTPAEPGQNSSIVELYL